MGKTLAEIAQQLKAADKKVQLIYAFNGTGKTRLSREFKNLVAPKNNGGEEIAGPDQDEVPPIKIIYYSAFTEDLFYWDNDLRGDAEPKLKILPSRFIDLVLKEQGLDQDVISTFQRYTNQRLTPHFNEDYTEVTFSLERGDNQRSGDLKISKGEESNFIWSFFYALLDLVISTQNVAEPDLRETRQFDQVEYVFIDDPVSSLDENNLIEMAVQLAGLIKSCRSELKFIVTTHNPLFYNVLHNELDLRKAGKKEGCFLLDRSEDGTFSLLEKHGDSNKSFSYHLYLKQTLEQAIAENGVERYHFTLLRNLYEKTAGFLGYPRWSALLPDDKQTYWNRIIQFTSHSTLSNEAVAEPTPQEKQTVKFLLNHLIENYGYWRNPTEETA